MTDEESTALLEGAPPSTMVLTHGLDFVFSDGQRLHWYPLVDGDMADASGRIPGWLRPDLSLVIIDVDSSAVDYVEALNSVNTAIAVNPIDGDIYVAGLRAHPYIRFEENSRGRFVQANVNRVSKVVGSDEYTVTLKRLNPHINRRIPQYPQELRDVSIADPRGAAWGADGQRLYVTGMSSDNVVVYNSDQIRAGMNPDSVIEVGVGPTGIAMDDARDQFYVLNRFEATISVVSTLDETEASRVSFFDPTPTAIKEGRPFFYDAHAHSGTGVVSCSSCHIDGKTDKIAWNLGTPTPAYSFFLKSTMLALTYRVWQTSWRISIM
jgi:hypothetical protein